MSTRRGPGLLVPVLMLVLASRVAAGAGEPSETLTTEDVVQRFVAGASTEQLVAEVSRSAVEFDLDEEMLDELRLAGIPQELIDAMVARQQELAPPLEADPEPAEATASGDEIVVRLNPQRRPGKPFVLELRDEVTPELRRRLQLEASLERESFDDLAIYLICRSPTHVPDHWRDASLLGRDFISMPRHRLLAFVSGAQTTPGRRGRPDLLELVVPETIRARLEPDDEHRLSVGLAVKIGDRYYRVTDDGRDDVAAGGSPVELGATIGQDGGRRLAGLSVRLDD